MFHLSEVGQKAIELRRVTSGLGIASGQIFQTRLEFLTIPIGITPSGQDVRCLLIQCGTTAGSSKSGTHSSSLVLKA